MKPLRSIFFGLVLLFPLAAATQKSPGTVEAEDPVAVAIDHLRNLEYDPAKQQLGDWVETHSDDLRAQNYLAVATLYQEMFRRGVLQASVYGEGGDVFKPNKVPVTPEFQQQLFSILDKAQGVAEKRLKNDSKDKAAMYWAGVSHGTRATYHFALRKEYRPALHEAKDAYQCHSDLLKLDPDYVDAYLVVGINNYVVGSLPWYYKALVTLYGRHGDRAEGLQQIKKVTERGNYAREDAKLMLAVLYQREKMYAPALSVYQNMARSYPRNYPLQYEVATLEGMLKDWNSAAQSYDVMLARHRARDAGYEDIPLTKILYQSGQAHEHLQENETALARYTEAASQPGNNHYVYLSELAAANLEMRGQRPEAARPHYQRVAEALPNSEEGKTARGALKKIDKN